MGALGRSGGWRVGRLWAVGVALVLAQGVAQAGGGLLGMDSWQPRHDDGIWSRNNQYIADGIVLSAAIGTALWEGTDSNAGKLAWKTMDSMVATAVVTEVMKNTFKRKRPSESTSPDDWFAGSGYKSFPSGETAMMAAAVAPAIALYADSNPAVWGLLAVPVYMAKARMMANGHWLSDVLVGGAIGGYVGVKIAKRDSPFLLGLTQDGVFVGYKKRF
ncbi:phosphatase PAP2 family protein [Leptothrix ochracea]|uniref:phosphatase PAP2 family protein n=1 Tax=Leptothrix ochracea TaxID=735331 RepID=UPI0034E21F64